MKKPTPRSMWHNFHWISLVVIFLFFPMGCQEEGQQTMPDKPNFIIIFADDLGYGDLGCYGHPTIRTPHLDQMAQEGMRFTQFYMAASICTPSRAGLLTGKLPVKVGMYGKRSVLFPDSKGGLPPSEITIAEALKEENYATACVGKWHLGHLPEYLPRQHGFDYFFGIPYSNDMSPAQSNWDFAKENFPPLPLIQGDSIIETEPDQSRLTERYTRHAIQFIRRQKDTPFFLYLAHTFPHVPLYVDNDNRGRSARGLYGDVVEVLDESVGQILEELKSSGLSKNTMVLFTSDNGPWGWAGVNGGSAGLLKGAKGSPWEGGFRVPAIAWMPGTVPAGQTNTSIGNALDVFPTLMEMATGQQPPQDDRDGRSLVNILQGEKDHKNPVHYYRQEKLIAYRNGPWKIFVMDPNPWDDEITDEDLPLLYNLHVDPSEKHNVAESNPGHVARLQQEIDAHLKVTKKLPSQFEK